MKKKKQIIRLADTNIYYEVGEPKPLPHVVGKAIFIAHGIEKEYFNAQTPNNKKRTETKLSET